MALPVDNTKPAYETAQDDNDLYPQPGPVVQQADSDELDDDFDDFDEEDFDDDFDDDFEEEVDDEYAMENDEFPDEYSGVGKEDFDDVEPDEGRALYPPPSCRR